MDEKFLGLERQLPHADLSTTDLEIMGRRAADMYLDKVASLNDAVLSEVRQHPDISSDQIRRVVEFANVDTFRSIFEKQAGDKNVNFDIADPDVVLGTLDKDARPVEKTAANQEYFTAPPADVNRNLTADDVLCRMFGMEPVSPVMEKMAKDRLKGGLADNRPDTAFDPAELRMGDKVEMEHTNDPGLSHEIAKDHLAEIPDYYTRLEEMEEEALGKSAMEHVKLGGVHADLVRDDLGRGVSLESIKKFACGKEEYPQSNPFGDLVRVRHKLVKMAEDSSQALVKNAYMIKEAVDSMAHMIEQSLYEGVTLGEITHALSKVGDADIVKEAMEEIVPRLVNRGLDLTQTQVDVIRYDMEKAATHRTINPDNELVKTFSAFNDMAKGYRELAKAADVVLDNLKEVDGVLKQAMEKSHVAQAQ